MRGVLAAYLTAMDKLEKFLTRAEAVLVRLEAMLPPAEPEIDWSAAVAFRWRKRQGRGYLQPVPAILLGFVLRK